MSAFSGRGSCRSRYPERVLDPDDPANVPSPCDTRAARSVIFTRGRGKKNGGRADFARPPVVLTWRWVIFACDCVSETRRRVRKTCGCAILTRRCVIFTRGCASETQPQPVGAHQRVIFTRPCVSQAPVNHPFAGAAGGGVGELPAAVPRRKRLASWARSSSRPWASPRRWRLA